MSDLERINGGPPAPFVSFALVGTARGITRDVGWLSKPDVGPPAVGLPAGDARREARVRVLDAAVKLFLELVLRSAWIGIAAQTELLDEPVALLVGR